MSFPTFSGSSRRPRNVNMSGQKNLNPFAATSWTPSASSTASKTVADAQAERRQRQQEREKLKAVESIQRIWRGHKVRRNLKDERRHILDDLYSHNNQMSSESRAAAALPLVVVVLDPRRSDDRARLERFATDLNESGRGIIKTAIPSHIRRLADQLILLLAWYVSLSLPLWLAFPLTSFDLQQYRSIAGSNFQTAHLNIRHEIRIGDKQPRQLIPKPWKIQSKWNQE